MQEATKHFMKYISKVQGVEKEGNKKQNDTCYGLTV